MEDMESMADTNIALNDLFQYNRNIACSLQQFLPSADREIIQWWFDKLDHMNETVEQMAIRSDYMWFILLMMQCRRISEPFTQLPPQHVMPLKIFVPLHVFEEVLIANESNMVYVQRKCSEDILKARQKGTTTTSCSALAQPDLSK